MLCYDLARLILILILAIAMLSFSAMDLEQTGRAATYVRLGGKGERKGTRSDRASFYYKGSCCTQLDAIRDVPSDPLVWESSNLILP